MQIYVYNIRICGQSELEYKVLILSLGTFKESLETVLTLSEAFFVLGFPWISDVVRGRVLLRLAFSISTSIGISKSLKS